MMKLLHIRLMIWKKQYKSVLFWFMLPLIVLMLSIVTQTNAEQNIRIPVGIVVDEQTPLIQEVVDSTRELPLVDPVHLSHDEALHQLEMHQLDSVFVFPANYDESIMQNERRGIVSHYTSNMSVAAIPMKESVLSLIQEQLNRSKAVQTVEQLFLAYDYPIPSRDSILLTSKKIQQNEQLIETSFSYTGPATTQNEPDSFISKWDLWVLFVLFSTVMLFDWVVREQRHPTFERVLFTSYQPKKYLLIHAIYYMALCVAIDAITLASLTVSNHDNMSTSIILVAISYRVTCTIGLFLFALCFKQRFSYLTGAIALFIVLIGTSGMFIPVEGISRHIPLYRVVHPLQPVLHGQGSFLWLGICLLLCIVWLSRKENTHVTRT